MLGAAADLGLVSSCYSRRWREISNIQLTRFGCLRCSLLGGSLKGKGSAGQLKGLTPPGPCPFCRAPGPARWPVSLLMTAA